jgi:hypothetical protein
VGVVTVLDNGVKMAVELLEDAGDVVVAIDYAERERLSNQSMKSFRAVLTESKSTRDEFLRYLLVSG